ncbi:MAG: Protein of unknown function (DUF1553)/Protein of unknown function (DUF1549)/Planctomycete, partial [Armatimonadetes bacterium]|nr:Protein of unknown function (DUF1553)/Protein of unknown function (DUF1549)/Planctomycete [Armatimonadota bacterium]
MSSQRNRKPDSAATGLLVISSVMLGSAALWAAPAPRVPAAVLRKPAPTPPAGGSTPAPSPEAAEFFEKKVRPILVESCFGCHNSKLSSPMGALRLDSRALAMKGGDRGPSVVPGNLEKSLLVKAVEYKDHTLQMPPKGKLPAEQIQVLTEWVKMGAPWPGDTGVAAPARAGEFNLKARRDGHWSFQPLQRPALPAVKRKEWPQSPIDYFTLAKLEAKGLAPAPAADRRTLLRRVTFDMTGLPPTPAEIDAFVNDRTPNAYQKVVDRLLASPAYGERWARHWLDLVRYAETDGHEFDFEKPNAWAYRDYVIRALNEDVPYNQFVREHVAGDLMTSPRRHPTERFNESVIATGFWFLGEGKHSPVDLLEDEAERVDNQIDVLSKAFLGLSVGCARCHDHKFDPIATKDYYALSGILKSTRYELANINDPAPTRQVVAEIQKLRERLTPLALEAAACGPGRKSPEFGRYLLAARTVLGPGGATPAPTTQAGDV